MPTASLLFGLDHRGLESIELVRPEPAQAFNPRSQLADSGGVQLVDAPLRIAANADEIGLPQDSQMLRNGRSSHLETARDFAGAERSAGKDFHDLPARRIA
jgi:hypothetical protein